MPTTHADVLIVGGGVIGSSIAYHLALRRTRVVVLDQAPPATPPSASWASAGGVRQQRRDPREWTLTRAAARRWPGLAGELGADIEFRHSGHLHVVETDDDRRVLEERVARERDAGLGVRIVDATEARRLAPGIADTVIAGAFSPGDGQADPIKTTRAFAAAAAARGASYRTAGPARLLGEGHRVRGAAAGGDTFTADTVVVAAGAWSAGLVRPVGVRLSIVPRGPQMILTDPAPAALAPTITGSGRALSLKQLPSGAYFIGGGWPSDVDAASMTCAVRDDSVRGSWRVATEVWVPLRACRIRQAWCGLEGESADGVPLIGPVPGVAGLYVAAGFSGHGFQLAPAVGAAVAAALHGEPAPGLDPLSPARAGAIGAG
ncbi:MAG TPA: FAD-dependent oxidoreductase [bacterium]|nr:FAD-dependent oxidoreductase [bacterium]